MKLSPQDIAGLTPDQKRALLKTLLEKKARDADALHPASRGQQALWFLHRLAPNAAAYNVFSAFRVHSPLDDEALRRAYQSLVERRAIFRTRYELRDGRLVQRIRPKIDADFEVVSVSDDEAALKERLAVEAHRPFDLETGSVLRARVFRPETGLPVMLAVFHHIATDYWSLRMFADELRAFYKAETTGEKADLPPIEAEYADFVRFQDELLAGERGRRMWDHWRTRLAGDLPLLNLPTDRPHPPAQSFRGDSVTRLLDGDLVARLKETATTRNSTLYTLLLAAYFVLLHRRTGQTDLVVGSPFSGRTSTRFKNVMGYFMNPVALRADLSGNPTFAEVLAQVRRTTLEALEHQDFPFSLLVERLHPHRAGGRPPIFQTMFVFERVGEQELHQLTSVVAQGAGRRTEAGGLALEPVHIEERFSQFDLTLSAAEVGATIPLSFQYDADLFDRATIERTVGHYVRLLEGIVERPDARIGELSLLTDAERHELLFERNRTEADYPRDATLHDLVKEQVERAPDRIAVECDGRRLTYRELDARAEAVAERLREAGVAPGTLVGLMIGRTIETAPAMLGILKAGCAYVPLDPDYPRERLEFIIRDAGLTVLVAEEGSREEKGSGFRVQGSGKESREIDNVPELRISRIREPFVSGTPNPDFQLRTLNPAYVLYTSGSTGKPKGVVVTHRNLVNFLWSMRREPGLTETDTLVAVTTLSFDISGLELYLPLLVGARIILVGRDTAADGAALREVLETSGATVMQATPTTWRLLVAAGWRGRPDFKALCGGEAFPADLAEQLLERAGEVWNLYGPTETTIWSTACRLISGEPVSLGAPIANTQIYLLDAYNQPVPQGDPGELCIGGDGVASGYLNRPELTAEKFISNPFFNTKTQRHKDANEEENKSPENSSLITRHSSRRLYRTGDLARYRSDGRLEFLGRLDNQVKVRGFRIELGDIESALLTHEAVKEAAVVVREDVPGDKRLVAYVVLKNNFTAKDAKEEKHSSENSSFIIHHSSFLEKLLPKYMIPTAFVTLDAWPLTPNGKIDRRALPAPEQSATPRTVAAPRTPTEELLVAVFEEVLRVGSVGIHDDFFALGGHSLTAVQVTARIRDVLGADLPVRMIFESPNVAGLAAIVARSESTAAEPIPRVSREHRLRLSFPQERLWFLDQFGQDGDVYNIPAAVRLVGPLDRKALQAALDEIVRRHESLRTVFASVEGEAVQKIQEPKGMPWTDAYSNTHPNADVREAGGREILDRLVRETFDLRHGPLVRACLIELGDDNRILVLVVHHIVADGWSLGVLARELSALYAAFKRDQPSPLPELPIQYADFAQRQRERFEAGAFDAQRAYWRAKLDGLPAALALPTDRPRPAMQTYRGRRFNFLVRAETAALLKPFCRKEGVTTFMTLLAVFETLLSRWSGQPDFAVGTPIAGRTRTELENLIGYFANTLVLRADVTGNPTFRELLARVKTTATEAYSHADVPFEKLVEDLRPERRLNRSPLFQVLFVLQNDPLPALDLAGIRAERIDLEGRTAKFDLTLALEERAEGLVGTFEYNTDLFDRETVERLAGQFDTLLAAAIAGPQSPISTLPVLTEDERRTILDLWSAPEIAAAEPACVHMLFEEQVERTPDALAVISETGRTTYRELNDRADRLAAELKTLGIGSESIVAVCLERSEAFVAAALGVLKAGGAYLPLDPSDPTERRAYLLEDSGAAALIQGSGFRVQGSGEESRKIDSFPELRISRIREPFVSGTPNPEPRTLNPAYVLYTSGSTGRPKGVVVEHRNVVNYLHWWNTAQPHRGAVIPFTTKPIFDASLKQFLAPLTVGGTVFIPPANYLENPRLLFEPFVDNPTHHSSLITHHASLGFNGVPALWSALLDVFESSGYRPENLTCLFVGGEACTDALLERTRKLFPNIDIWNLYGPTETTANACAGPLKPGEPVTVGRPVGGTSVYILDEHLNPVPVGTPGELCVGGAGVARGYLNRPELTAERFISNPFFTTKDTKVSTACGSERVSSALLYRTGDRACFLPDGRIKVLGRTDAQVKIRGVRVELGEIEAALAAHEAVREAVVLLSETANGPQLTAYVAVDQAAAPTAENLRAFLARSLPEAMVPGDFVVLADLPRLPNGKTDRRSLAALEPTTVSGDVSEPPATPTEALVAEIFADVLHRPTAGRRDDFFALGGHSLAAVRVVAGLRSRFGVEVPLATLFESPTPEKLALRIDKPESSDVPVLDLEREAVLPKHIRPADATSEIAFPPREVFLTGATGFFGAFLLDELLRTTDARVHCLVRALNVEEGHAKLEAALAKYGLETASVRSRTVVVEGDLESSNLGMTVERFDALAGELDAVYHNGALVNFVYPYQALKPANVLGTLKVLRLACRGKRKAFHYVSTLSVFGADVAQTHPTAGEDLEPDVRGGLVDGYPQSKWVAERLVVEARARGLAANVYRLGRITGDSRTGAWNTDDFLRRVVKGCLQLGAAPALDMELDMTPVDFAARALVALSLAPASLGGTFHLLNPRPIRVRDFFERIAALGHQLQLIEYDRWREELSENLKKSSENALYSLWPVFNNAPSPDLRPRPRFDCSNTLQGLAGTSINCPVIDDDLLSTYFQTLIQGTIE